jgi:hypothetical protein
MHFASVHGTDSEPKSSYHYHISQLKRVEASKAAEIAKRTENKWIIKQLHHKLIIRKGTTGMPPQICSPM